MKINVLATMILGALFCMYAIAALAYLIFSGKENSAEIDG